jgi:hypothetical protein
LLGWRGVDQAAQTYRVLQFQAHGLMLWDSGWYGGNFPLGYSVLFPPVAALFGLQVVAVASAVVATWSFDRVVRTHLGSRPLGTWYFAISTLLPVAIGQWPFLAGEAAGLAALVVLQRGRRPLALALGIVAALFSPLAAAFLAMVCLAWAAYGTGRRRWYVATAAVSLAVIFLTGVLFPGTGPFPFPWTGLVATELLCLTALTPLVRTTPAVRLGALFYAAASFFSFVFPNPLGGNAPRLAASIGVPLLACFLTAPGPAVSKLSHSGLVRRLARGRSLRLSTRWRVAGVALVVPFALWQWAPGQGVKPATAPGTQASFYAPLVTELAAVAPGPVRVEVTPTRDHWEAAFVAPHVSLARGWERQLDIGDNPLFYTPGALTAASYVAEGALLRSGQLSDLSLVWSTSEWTLWHVTSSPGLVSGPALLTSMEPDHLILQVSKPGLITLRVRYTKFWTVTSGKACVGPTSVAPVPKATSSSSSSSPPPPPWTAIHALTPGTLELSATVLHTTAPPQCPTS